MLTDSAESTQALITLLNKAQDHAQITLHELNGLKSVERMNRELKAENAELIFLVEVPERDLMTCRNMELKTSLNTRPRETEAKLLGSLVKQTCGVCKLEGRLTGYGHHLYKECLDK